MPSTLHPTRHNSASGSLFLATIDPLQQSDFSNELNSLLGSLRVMNPDAEDEVDSNQAEPYGRWRSGSPGGSDGSGGTVWDESVSSADTVIAVTDDMGGEILAGVEEYGCGEEEELPFQVVSAKEFLEKQSTVDDIFPFDEPHVADQPERPPISTDTTFDPRPGGSSWWNIPPPTTRSRFLDALFDWERPQPTFEVEPSPAVNWWDRPPGYLETAGDDEVSLGLDGTEDIYSIPPSVANTLASYGVPLDFERGPEVSALAATLGKAMIAEADSLQWNIEKYGSDPYTLPEATSSLVVYKAKPPSPPLPKRKLTFKKKRVFLGLKTSDYGYTEESYAIGDTKLYGQTIKAMVDEAIEIAKSCPLQYLDEKVKLYGGEDGDVEKLWNMVDEKVKERGYFKVDGKWGLKALRAELVAIRDERLKKERAGGLRKGG